MRKILVAINVTVDGYCDHTAVIADDDLHKFYSDFLDKIDISIMGRVTYQLMESYWPNVAKKKIGTEAEILFAEKLNNIQKIVISRSLENVTWQNTSIISENMVEEITKLKQQNGKPITIGGLSIISQLTKKGLIDEFFFVIQPIILGKGMKLFSNFDKQVDLELISKKSFDSGSMVVHYCVKK
jgi:dihydrofolate reductase